ncbi:MAG: tetratricopeptide (TPR) repeat protein [Glaciecola sp.]|jgi:tetratricopeptide (TPR) repeat protein
MKIMNKILGTKLLKTTSVIVLLLMTTASIQAQNNPVADAFTQSYYFEKVSNYPAAIAALKKVYSDTSYEINLRLGWLTYSAASYQESVNYYQICINLMPVSIEARLGIVYPAAALGNMTQVIAEYSKILEIDPQNTVANYKLGYIYYDKKEYQTSYKYFEKVVNLYPFDYDGLLMFAWTNYRLGKTREAKVLFGKILLLSPGDASGTEGLGLIK